MFTSEIIRRALDEDLGGQEDITSVATIPSDLSGQAVILAKEDLHVAGLGIAGAVFSDVDPRIELSQCAKDGAEAQKNQVLLKLSGNVRSLLRAERVALNFLQRLCGIASLTAKFVKETKGNPTQILDTRKTTPMFRHLEKYAVRMGGGVNHRFGLFDEIMIKDNHVAAMKGDVVLAARKARAAYPDKKMVVEIDQIDQIKPELFELADRLLLDNMSNDQISDCQNIIQGRIPIEISGNVSLERVKSLADLKVDFISVGALTHSVPAANLGLDVQYV